MSYRDEKVVSGESVTREMDSSLSKKADHHGVKVTTDKGNEWLIHSTPDSGNVVTDAANMSKRWTTDEGSSFTCGDKTIGDVMKASSGKTNHPLTNYVTGGTCIIASKRAANFCKDAAK